MSDCRVPVDRIRFVAGEALRYASVPADHSLTQINLLLEAELRGVPSHGFLRLERIIRRIGNGVCDPRTKGLHEWRSAGVLSVDGQRGMGPVVANEALRAITERARQTGVAIATIANSNHIGMLGWYAENVALNGQAIVALSTSEALVHPWGGRRALIGTNPIAIGVPTEGDPFVMDMATSVVSMGEIHHHANQNKPIPPNWALDAEGNPTTDAKAAKAGAIAPFGEAKGYSLGLAFELLVTALTGSAIGTDVQGTLDDVEFCNKGDVFIVIDGSRTAGLASYLDLIRNSAPASGFDRVLVPGDRARASRAKRLIDGVTLPDEVWSRLNELAHAAECRQQVSSR